MLDSQAESYLDLSLLDRTFEGRKALLRSLVEEFRSQVETLLPKMRELFEQGDYKGLEYSAHTLKGNSSLVGAFMIQDLSKAIESASRDKDFSDTATRIEELAAVADKTLEYLDRLVNE